MGMSACSNEQVNDDLSSESSKVSKPYISPKMQEIINMVDTSNEAIPIEKLCPFTTNSELYKTDNSAKLAITRTNDDGSTVITGYTTQSVLYYKKEATINDVQALNFNVKKGTYYVTCYAITKNLLFSSKQDTLYNAYQSGDIMAINPDNLNTIGYNINVRYSGRYYTFTTYIWGLSVDDTTNSGDIYYPQIPDGEGFYEIMNLGEYVNRLQWRYIAF
jgi:hypothetical protein